MPAAGALQQRCPHRPRFVVPASRTTKTLRPAELTQILSTGLLGGETRLARPDSEDNLPVVASFPGRFHGA